MKTAKRLCVFMLAMVMLFFTGCWNYHEVDNMSMVSGFAIDKGTEGHKYHVTFEFLDLTANAPNAKLLETDGDTIHEAIRNAIGKSAKKLYFSHAKVIIISQEIASDGLAPILDNMMRDAEPRLTLNLIVSKEKTAREILQQKAVTDKLICLEIVKSLNQNTANLSESPNVELYQVCNMIAEDGISLILPTVKATKTPNESTAELDGTAVFKQDKLLGYLSKDETKFLLFIKDKIKGGLLLTGDDGGKPTYSLEILDSKTKITPIISDNDLTMKIDVQSKVVLSEDLTSKESMSAEQIKEMQKQAGKTIETGISDVIKDVQFRYNSDIFGFGNKIYKANPNWWSKAKPNWDQYFHNLKYTISANVTIENTSCAKSKIKVGD